MLICSQVVPWNEAQKVLNVTVSSLGEPKHFKQGHNHVAAPKSSSSSTARPPPPLTPSTPGVHYSTTYTPNGYFTTVAPYKNSSKGKNKKKYEASQVIEFKNIDCQMGYMFPRYGSLKRHGGVTQPLFLNDILKNKYDND